MIMFSLSFVEGSNSAEGGKYPLGHRSYEQTVLPRRETSLSVKD